ncbi:MAG: hypothetical protein JF564_02335, partial [Sphingomonas sp.]|nr:hypothetical protein [Sphingomonas sp.]
MLHDASLHSPRLARNAILDHGRAVLEVEARALATLGELLDEQFARAVELIV